MIRTYKRKLILTKVQENRINSWIGACRLVYNLGLELQEWSYRNSGKYIHKFELQKQITVLRKDFEWINDAPSGSLHKMMHRLDDNYSMFFKKVSRKPKFAAKKHFKSMPFRSVFIRDGAPFLHKLGKLKIVKDTPILGVPRTASIIKAPTGYFICIQCKDVPASYASENQAIGLDMGISHFCIDSNGKFIANPKHFKRYEKQLRIKNRSLSRKKRFSNGWKKQAKRVALLHHKIANARKDFLHKESTRIAKLNDIVYIEDLDIREMIKNKTFSSYIADVGWGLFKEMLSYKTTVVKIDPKHTSQSCNECGTKDSGSRISQSKFKCTNCGHEANADINAAKNILGKGIALTRQREALACA